MNELAFEKLLDQWVSARLTEPMHWNQLLYALPSVYPATVWESAQRLSLSDRIYFGCDRSAPSLASFAHTLWCHGELPTPHPEDSLWWFGDAALERLFAELRASASAGALLLGTPSLYHYAKGHGSIERLLLLDRDAPTFTAGQCQSLSCDLLADSGTNEKFGLIVADPPWYPLETRAFLLAALRRSRPGTRVLISVPGVGTRPGIQREWQELLVWAEDRGLRLLDYQARALPYISPLFERNALRAAGINDYPTDWRRGDLAVLKVDRVMTVEIPARDSHCKWKEVRFGHTRLRIRNESCNGWQSPQLRSLLAGDILPSVSRRDKRLKSVGAWTSGNRVFACENCFALWRIAEAMSRGECPTSELAASMDTHLDADQREEVRKVVTRLSEIVRMEEQEIQDWRTEGNENVVELPAHQI